MKKIRYLEAVRGRGEYGWLKSRYSFSFGDWHDSRLMGFGMLRVLNDDIIVPGAGFGMHGHRDMEIVTLVTQGVLAHTDSMGNAGTIRAGDVQAMSAGTGVMHSEYNRESKELLKLFQIWIEPRERGAAPSYAQKAFGSSEPGITLLVSSDGRDGSLAIGQDASISRAILGPEPLSYELAEKGNGAYIFVIEGEVEAAGERLGPRDALGVLKATEAFSLSSPERSDALIIEVPMR